MLALLGAVSLRGSRGSRGAIRSGRSAPPRREDPRLDRVVAGYIEAALWSSHDDEDNALDAVDAELSEAAKAELRQDCADFLDSCDDADLDLSPIGSGQIGHDFWLTRNHHGAGFWDRGLGELGDRLTTLAHAAGGRDLYVSDAGAIEVR